MWCAIALTHHIDDLGSAQRGAMSPNTGHTGAKFSGGCGRGCGIDIPSIDERQARLRFSERLGDDAVAKDHRLATAAIFTHEKPARRARGDEDAVAVAFGRDEYRVI